MIAPMLWAIVGMGLVSILEGESMTFGQIRDWYPLAKALSDRNKAAT